MNSRVDSFKVLTKQAHLISNSLEADCLFFFPLTLELPSLKADWALQKKREVLAVDFGFGTPKQVSSWADDKILPLMLDFNLKLSEAHLGCFSVEFGLNSWDEKIFVLSGPITVFLIENDESIGVYCNSHALWVSFNDSDVWEGEKVPDIKVCLEWIYHAFIFPYGSLNRLFEAIMSEFSQDTDGVFMVDCIAIELRGLGD